MRKVLIFKKGLKEKIIELGFEKMKDEEVFQLFTVLLEIKFKEKDISFKSLLDAGLECKEALLLACAYELGKRRPILGKSK